MLSYRQYGERGRKMNYYKVMFIGSGYEVVFQTDVYAASYDNAFEIADKMYKDNNWTFHYCHVEAEML